MSSRVLERIALAVLFGGFLIWAALFLYQSSYIGLDGHRYYGLFDDAMISMRYAWNFAHGQGLVWNAGQRVEGYSNLLMTLVMAVAAVFLEKPLAVLAVQIFGVLVMLGTAWIVRKLAGELTEGKPYGALIGLISVACVLFYYPLSYWTLMGMETGLLTLLLMSATLFALRWRKDRRDQDLLMVSICAGLAFLTRNDSIILSAIIFGFFLLEAYASKWERKSWLRILYAGALVLIFPIAQTAFRLLYYGQLLPNTYVLKLTRFPLSVRIAGGVQFTVPFLEQTALVLLLAAAALALNFKRVRLFLFSLILAALAYQVYVGGDPWLIWRMLAPAMPALFILAALAGADLAARWPWLGSHKYITAVLILLFSSAALFLTDQPFLSDMSVRAPTSAAIANRVNTNSAIAINHMTRPGATVGVIWAGTLPYYTDRQAVDFLGKSDPYIANLNADISGAVSWNGMKSVPGHNKYKLNYSIVELQPTYIQVFSWGDQTVKPWVTEHYVRVEYHGIQSMKTLFLKKDSPDVCWDGCGNDYKLIPWPKQGQNSP